jgi:hypothetical protein
MFPGRNASGQAVSLSLNDWFDPLKNYLTFPGLPNDKYQVKYAIEFFKSLSSTALKEIVSLSMSPNWKARELVEELFFSERAVFPPWFLPFSTTSVTSSARHLPNNVAQIVFYYPVLMLQETSEYYWKSTAFKFTRNPVQSISDPMGPWIYVGTEETFKKNLKIITKAYEKEETINHYGSGGNISAYMGGQYFHAFESMLHFIFDHRMFDLGDGRPRSRTEAATSLTSTPNYSIIAAYTSGVGFQVLLSRRYDWESRQALYQNMNYTTRVTNILQWPRYHDSKKEAKNPLYGVELEFSTEYDIPTLVDAQEADLFAIYKQDSSVNGRGTTRTEMVTVPASIQYLKRAFARWFHRLDTNRFDTTRKTNNGMHVHISRRAFQSGQHQRNFTWFVSNPLNKSFLFDVSERAELSEFHQYAKFPKFHGRTLANSHRNTDVALMAQDQPRHACVNITGTQTIELRIFKGIVSYATVLKNLEFTDALVEYTRQVSFTHNTVSDFLRWVFKTNKSRYTCLKAFLKTLDKSKLDIDDQFNRLVYGLHDPLKILARVNGRGIDITEERVLALNETLGEDVFALDDKDKTRLKVIYQIGGRLAARDQEFSSRYIPRESPPPTILSPAERPPEITPFGLSTEAVAAFHRASQTYTGSWATYDDPPDYIPEFDVIESETDEVS